MSRSEMSTRRRTVLIPVVGAVALLSLVSCTAVGPDFKAPTAPVIPNWYQEEIEGLKASEVDLVAWWKVFDDLVLDHLVETAHLESNTLEIAALRVLEARAQLGISTGMQWPQAQVAIGDATYISPTEPNGPVSNFGSYNLGASVAWEIDFWGRYRRGIEASDAGLHATMARYDEALVLLTAQVVQTYTSIRLTEEQLRIAQQNIVIQQRSYEIVEVLYRFGEKAALDLEQAKTLLLGTQATVPKLEAALQKHKNALSTLLGRPPGGVDGLLGGESTLPEIPEQIIMGIPADMLRRRPDVRTAEMNAMAQNALVGVATADLYPSFSLMGFLGLSSGSPGDDTIGDLFSSSSLTYNVGMGFTWPFFNYGRIRNNIRVQDARLQQALIAYRETVIQATREVEDAMTGYVGAQRQARILAEGVVSANRSNEISMLRYREGFSDYQRVLNAQQALFSQQGRLIDSRGSAVLAVVDLYKALGGGWEIHGGAYEISPATREEMQQRTNWGDYLESETNEDDGNSGGSE